MDLVSQNGQQAREKILNITNYQEGKSKLRVTSYPIALVVWEQVAE